MNKRIISLVLCLTLMMSFFVPAVSAQEDDVIYIDSTVPSIAETEPVPDDPAEEYTDVTEEDPTPANNGSFPVETEVALETVPADPVTEEEIIPEDNVVSNVVGGDVDNKYAGDPTITVGGAYADTDNNNVCTWYATASGSVHDSSDGLSTYYDTVVTGPGTFYIKLQSPKSGSGYLKNTTSGWEDTLFIDMRKLIVRGGAHVIVDVGAEFDASIKYVYLRTYSSGTQSLFDVENGSIEFTGDSYRQIIISGRNATDYYKTNPLIKLSSGATSFKADWCDFRQAWNRAILVWADELQNFEMNNCAFQNTIHCKKYGGGVIYIDDMVGGSASNARVDVYNFKLNNCTFNQNTANDDGGAIMNAGRLYNVHIKGCKFNGSYSDQIGNSDGKQYGAYGGAICFKGDEGKILIENTTFENCTSYTRGGAVCFIQGTYAKSGNYKRTNSVEFRGCTFKNCKSRSSHGGAIAVEKQLHTMKVYGCTFDGCKSAINGAAISLDSSELPDTFNSSSGKTWTEAFNESLYGVRNKDTFTWPLGIYTTVQCFDVDALKNDNGQYVDASGNVTTDSSKYVKTQIKNCIATASGGGIEFASEGYVADADIKNTVIDGCMASKNGSALFMSTAVVETLDMENVLVQNCDFIKTLLDSNGNHIKDSDGHYVVSSDPMAQYVRLAEAAGTVRSTGAATCKLTMKNCLLQDNFSLSNGAGLYWNANTNRTSISGEALTCSAYVQDCTFTRNYAEDSGGAIYCEAVMTVDHCEIYENACENYGGGIGQQVYSNNGRLMSDGEQTNLTVKNGTKIYNNYSERDGGGISIRANPTQSIQPSNKGVKHSVIFNLQDSYIYNNTANDNGGGVSFKAIYGIAGYSDVDANGNIIDCTTEEAIKRNDAEVDSYTKSIIITNGHVYNNRAGVAQDWSNNKAETVGTGNGGGIYMESSKDTTLAINSGSIYSNVATNGKGGGVYLTGEEAMCSITGGTIGGTPITVNGVTTEYKNTAKLGGGIALEGGSTIHMTIADGATHGGTVSYNEASSQGGGIWLGNGTASGAANGANTFTIEGGLVTRNKVTASSPTNANGGGVHIGEYGYIEVKGGDITFNSTPGWGGGIFANNHVTFKVSDGNVSYNTAHDGGGIGLQSDDTMTFSGGTITNNTATSNGGGIYANSTCNVTISGGNIQYNTANGIGGGVYGNTSTITITNGATAYNYAGKGGGIGAMNQSTFTINGGNLGSNGSKVATADDNTAIVCTHGGGVYASASTVNLNGGFTNWNAATNGGGVAAVDGSTVVATKGGITWNEAGTAGGGIYANGNSTVTVSGGNVMENVSNNYGGGIYAVDGSDVTVSGGYISGNIALTGGGIFAQGGKQFANGKPVYDTVITVVGGEISNNKANGLGTYNGQGGGIHADCFVDVTVKESSDGKTVGKITGNSASKGGGVYVCYGAKLTVIDGFITKNIASYGDKNRNTNTTTYQLNHGLYGVGGGVYVADGYSADVPAQFSLSGDNIAIYDNTADFAADDVFSSGKNTKLDVPEVQNMNLSGYSLKPDGWVEDYCVADTKYELGTESVLGTKKFVNGNNNGTVEANENVRYRSATRFQRIVIDDPFVASAINAPNAFVCMTLGISSMLPEQVGHSFYLVDEEGNFLNEKGEIVDDISEAYKVIDPLFETVTGDTFEVDAEDVFTKAGLDDMYDLYEPDASYKATYNEKKDGKTYNYWETQDKKDTTYVTTDGGKTYSNEDTSYDPNKPDADMKESIVYFPVIAPKVAYSFYLVDQNGNPIAADGEIVSDFKDCEKLLDPVYQYIIKENFTLDAKDAFEASDLSDLFELYSPNASYEIIFNDEQNGKTYNYWETEDSKNSTYVTTDGGNSFSNADTNFDANKPNGDMSNSMVYYALRLKEIAVEDKVVIDFGIPVKINVLSNDGLTNNSKVVGIKKTNTVPAAGTAVDNTYVAAGTTVKGSYGSFVLSSDNIVKYSLTDMKMTDVDVITYAAQDAITGYHYYAKVTVIPATTIYFEDNFKKSDGKTNYVTYSTFTYTEGSTEPAKSVDNQWTSVGNAASKTQDEDRPGQVTGTDANNIYGYDGAYNQNYIQTYSMGSAMKFTATQNGTTKTFGTATFQFTGTGFDIISLTSRQTGTVMVEVKKGTAVVKQMVVNTYYGYKYDGTKWVVDNSVKDSLYQIPVIKVCDLDYATYTVTLTVTYNGYFDYYRETGDVKSYDFYLDAIRIYDPANDGAKNNTIKDAYVADNEGWPEYHELRNLILDPDGNGKLDSSTTLNGVVFIDNSAGGTPTISQYRNYGPNNEVYLAQNQSIAFTFTPPANMASVQIGLRCSQYKTSFKISTADGKSISKTVHGSDVYYDITDLLRDSNGKLVSKTVTIQCGDTYWDSAVLAISNVKITYKSAPSTTKSAPFSVTQTTVDETLAYLAGTEGELDAISQIGIVGATLSFEDEIRTNLYFTSDLGGVDAAKMGLMTWSVKPEEISVETAENVFSGAVYVEDNDQFMVQTDGIAAKNLGDDIYMVVYAELENGEYAYSEVITYSPKQYAMSRLQKSSNEELKALCVAMLNYGAAAQNYFGYKTDALMNADLTAEQQALVTAYNADLFNGALAADAAKIGSFAKTESGFTSCAASVSFEGAFAINYYFGTDAAADVSFYIWNAKDYANAQVLTAENASSVTSMKVLDNGSYWAQIDGIAAKDLDETFYVAAVYTVNGETFCSGVIAYSLSTYCMKLAANGSAMQALAQSTAVYGYYADTYFNVEG